MGPCLRLTCAAAGSKCFQNSGGSEDCIYLNVWTADWPVKSHKPVMVWVHGAANLTGSAVGMAGVEPEAAIR
jgi:para-nitrobenzyl esterase